MRQIFDIHEYDDNFFEKFTLQILPNIDIWSIRPLKNPTKIFAHGLSSELNKFESFLIRHQEKDYPVDLIIILAVAQKHYPRLMLNSSKKYLKLSFNNSSLQNTAPQLILFPNTNTKNTLNNDIQYFGFNYRNNAEIPDIIKQNIQNAENLVRAELEKIRIQKEAETDNRTAELERKLEQFKFDLKVEAFQKKEKETNERIEHLKKVMAKKTEALNEQKNNEINNVKENTKVIAEGLFRLGKKLFFDNNESKLKEQNNLELKDIPENKENKKKEPHREDNGFEEITEPQNNSEAKKDDEKINLLCEKLKHLSPVEKRILYKKLSEDITKK
ncbi:MAG: hypothetical protein A2046_06855 [Bacteroidetes bacterium GWA2_30_7]|nr:MAG: hypothetical protein A2046_06855 [Bacteroidetes bacterium GWA2_30_7]